MFVASLLDLGASYEKLQNVLKTVPAEGFHTKVSKLVKSGLSVCDFSVLLEAEYENHDHDMEFLTNVNDNPILKEVEGHHEHQHHEHQHHNHKHTEGHHHHEHAHRGLFEVLEIIEQTQMSVKAKEIAKKIFQILGEAEAKAHGQSIESVHFHEVGAVDSIVDIISAAVCIDDLDVNDVIFSKLYEGTGKVRSQHGVLPVPVPAVLNIVSAHNLQLHIMDQEGEFITPTGAAIVAATKTKDVLPESFQILATGIGAGKRAYKNPSMVRSMLIQREGNTTKEKELCKLESNIDDSTGEMFGYLSAKLFEHGAKDVYFTPIYMKKNRPAYQINVICDLDKADEFEKIIFRESTTIGIRKIRLEREILAREQHFIKTSLGEANVKICKVGEDVRIYPEYESVIELCKSTGKSFPEVFRLIERESYGKF